MKKINPISKEDISPPFLLTNQSYMWNKQAQTKRGLYWIHNTTTYKSCCIILKFVGGKTHAHTHIHTHLPTVGRDGCVAMEICRLPIPLSQCWFVSLSSFLHFLLLPPSCPSFFFPTLIFICSCYYLCSSLMS